MAFIATTEEAIEAQNVTKAVGVFLATWGCSLAADGADAAGLDLLLGLLHNVLP